MRKPASSAPHLAVSVLAIALVALGLAAGAAPPQKSLLGFAPERVAEQLALEARLDAQLSADNLRQWLKQMSARPNHVGSPQGLKNAEMMVALFRSWGYEAAIEEFHVLFPTPKERLLEMVAPTPFKASLEEDALPEDSTSGQKAEQLPTYNAYSIDGDVTGELVFVNDGLPKDYEELAKRGIDVEGKIVIAKYYGSWRGIKPKVAAEHGAIGCIIYTDPASDGYAQGDVYPKGGWRPNQGVQRGSVADAPQRSGDALTPFVGATKDAKRLALSEATTLTKIPVLPISARDAQPLLAALGGPIAPADWRGALPIPYHLGPGPAKVHLKLAFNWDLVPARDVIAKLPGAERPDQWVIRGNHFDGWVNGATDPLSGMVALLEEARALGELAKAGWRPKRTIVYAGWDGEEPGLLGSTEWVEAHAELLSDKAVAYVNSDSRERGFFGMAGSHTLETFMNEVVRDVVDPEKGISVGERLRAYVEVNGSTEVQKEAREGKLLRLSAMGSGSDYTPFIQHLGVASLNIGYGDEGDYGQYHSIYDSFDHYVRFMDPTFQYGVALAQTGGRIVLRLANADVLPFELGRLAGTVAGYVDEVKKLADELRESTAEENRRLEQKVYEAVADPTETFVAPAPKEPVPYLNFAPLDNAVAALDAAVERYREAETARQASGRPLAPPEQARLDEILMQTERALLRKEGLPGRPWYRHHLYAPGKYTGYGVKTLPGVREAIELRKYGEAGEQIEVLARVLASLTAEVDEATAVMKGP